MSQWFTCLSFHCVWPVLSSLIMHLVHSSSLSLSLSSLIALLFITPLFYSIHLPYHWFSYSVDLREPLIVLYVRSATSYPFFSSFAFLSPLIRSSHLLDSAESFFLSPLLLPLSCIHFFTLTSVTIAANTSTLVLIKMPFDDSSS